MARSPENYSHEPLLYTEQFDLMDRRPKTIQKQTAFWIDAYLTGQNVLLDKMGGYLQEYTLPFVRNVREGLGYYQKIAKISDKKYLDSVIAKNVSRALPETSDQKAYDAMEAFNFALTTFWYLPNNHTIEVGGRNFGFSLRGNLKPPQTVDEFLWRSYELHNFVTGMIDQSTPQGLWVSTRGNLLRPVAFFKTGATMPLSHSGSEVDKTSKRRVKPLDSMKQLFSAEELKDMDGGLGQK